MIKLREHPKAPLAYLDARRQVLHIADLATDPAYDQHDPRVATLVESAGARTLVIVPMFKEDELIGAIGIYRTEVLRLDPNPPAVHLNDALRWGESEAVPALLPELSPANREIVT